MDKTKFREKLIEVRRFLAQEDYSEALLLCEKLARQFPGSPAVWMEYGIAAANLQQFGVAETAWNRASQLKPDDPQLLIQIANQLKIYRQPDKARASYAKAIAVAPLDIEARIGLAGLLERNHCLEEARAIIVECLAINPCDEQALYLAAVLDRRENKLDKAEQGLRDLLASEPKHPYVQHASRFELAQLLDATGRFDEAMQQLAEGKRILRTLADTESYLREFDQAMDQNTRMIRALPKNILQQWAEIYSKEKSEPVQPLAFLGGHPRSGTTLIEKILGAHPGIAALDEPHAFMRLVGPKLRKLKSQQELTVGRRSVFRQLYVQGLQREPGVETAGKLLLDKNPSLTRQLSHLLQLFPEMRVLIALRDPRDVLLSCYFQHVPLNAGNANFLSFERLVKHYATVMDVWLAMREWEGFAWMETRYEDVVNDLEKEGRRVTQFLGLPWDEQQAQFFESKQPVHSPTYRDVVQPVYAKSVARWQRYEKHLAPVLPALDPYCRVFGY